jgi:penicillin-binding protein 2
MQSSAAFEDRRNLDTRLAVLRVGAIAAVALLAISFWLLQVVQHAKFREMSENNALRTIPERAPRGVLFDRNGKVLVEDRYSWTIVLLREQIRDLDETIRVVARVTETDEKQIRDIVTRRRREPSFRPLPIVENATLGQVAAIRARQLELPGVKVQEVPTRSYPAQAMAAHLFGYVSEIQESQLETAEFAGLQSGAVVGQAGLERVYNARLMGQDGKRDVVVNSLGREIEILGSVQPIEGRPLQLTIDYDLQSALEDGFRINKYAGAGVVLDPYTGEVLAMTSLPAYDPNEFAVGIAGARWSQLTRDPQTPLTNRLIQGRYSPGSTFKIAIALTALAEGVITPDTTFFCPGHGTFYGHTFRCWRAAGHGTVDLRHAIEQSCNVYFYNVGSRLKIDSIQAYATKLGLVGKTGIDLPGENASLVPSTEWKLRSTGERWYASETISVAIGQGAVSITPLSLATMMAVVANGGTLVTPHVVRSVDSGEGWQAIPPPAPRSVLPIKPDHLAAVRDGLWLVVNGAAGTARASRLEGRDMAGKTGTAQVISLEGARVAAGKIDVRDHGWFVFMAPKDNPKIVGVVLAEHGEHGTAAAPIAKHVVETYFAKREGRPLPTVAATSASATAAAAAAGTARTPVAPAGRGGGGDR